MGIEVTVFTIYYSISHVIEQQILTNLFQQITKPVFLTGDFNSYHEYWGNSSNDRRRNKVLNFTQKHQLYLMNYVIHT